MSRSLGRGVQPDRHAICGRWRVPSGRTFTRRASNEAAFLYQVFVRHFGTNNFRLRRMIGAASGCSCARKRVARRKRFLDRLVERAFGLGTPLAPRPLPPSLMRNPSLASSWPRSWQSGNVYVYAYARRAAEVRRRRDTPPASEIFACWAAIMSSTSIVDLDSNRSRIRRRRVCDLRDIVRELRAKGATSERAVISRRTISRLRSANGFPVSSLDLVARKDVEREAETFRSSRCRRGRTHASPFWLPLAPVASRRVRGSRRFSRCQFDQCGLDPAMRSSMSYGCRFSRPLRQGSTDGNIRPNTA